MKHFDRHYVQPLERALRNDVEYELRLGPVLISSHPSDIQILAFVSRKITVVSLLILVVPCVDSGFPVERDVCYSTVHHVQLKRLQLHSAIGVSIWNVC